MSARATWIALAALFALVATSGCSILNAPDRTKIDAGGDAGPVDANFDGGIQDGSPQDGNSDGRLCTEREQDCDGAGDTDCDGLIGCADYECAALAQCCQEGSREALWDWAVGALADRWNRIPSSNPSYPSVSGGVLSNFDDDAPHGVVSNVCVPLAAGKEIRTALEVEAAGCDTCFASIILTPARDSVAGLPIVRDIGVTLYGNGNTTVTRGTTELWSASAFVSPGEPLEVSIQITVGADDAGRPSALATIVVTPRGSPGEAVTAVTSRAIVPLAQLYDESGTCTQVPGLFIAAEGMGSSVSVDDIELYALDCVNPSQFTAPATDPPATADELDWGDWSGGGIAAPSVAAYLFNESMPENFQWHVLADGTDQDRTLDPVVTEFGYGIGHSTAVGDGWGAWRSTTAAPAGPRFGACSVATCSPPGMMSFREPSIVPVHEAMQLVVAYAKWRSTETYAIAAHRMSNDPAMSSGTGAELVVAGSENAPDCLSVRDPALVQKPRGTGFWLFFTCEKTGGRAEIHAVELASESAVVASTHTVVLSPDAVGPYGRGAVRAPEVIVEVDPDGVAQRDVYRMWFTAQPAGFGESTIAVATAQVDEDTEGLPAFVPYPANPVLTSDERALGPACTDCQLLGIAVTQIPNREGTYRFLVARSVNDRTEYELRPLDQFWRPPWPPGT